MVKKAKYTVVREMGRVEVRRYEPMVVAKGVETIGELEMLQTLFPDAVCISAKMGFGLEQLGEAVLEKYKGGELLLHLVCSQSNGKVQSFLRAYGKVLKEQYLDGSVLIDAKLGRNQLAGLKKLHPENIEIVT